MRFQPKTEDELNPLLVPGDYQAEVFRAEKATSKKGNEMIKVSLRVFYDGGTVILNDYLTPAWLAKLKHFCDSAGLVDLYEQGELTAEACQGANVIASIKVKDDPEFGRQNAVADYVTKPRLPKNPPAPLGTGMTGSQVAALNAQADGDDIPF